jgi:hypothetical protein
MAAINRITLPFQNELAIIPLNNRHALGMCEHVCTIQYSNLNTHESSCFEVERDIASGHFNMQYNQVWYRIPMPDNGIVNLNYILSIINIPFARHAFHPSVALNGPNFHPDNNDIFTYHLADVDINLKLFTGQNLYN